MHFFVEGEDLKDAIKEFWRAGIKEAVIRATLDHSVELSGFYKPKESWGTAVRLWVNVPLSRDAAAAACDTVKVQLRELHGIPTGEVEIEADCFGFFVNHAMYGEAIVDCPRSFAEGMSGLDWDNSAGVNVKPEDCRSIAWAMRAMGSTEELCKRGFDRLCIRGGVAEAADGFRAHRANVSFGSPEMLVPSAMADLMSRRPGTLNFRADDEQEFAEYRAGYIRMETVRLIVGTWPDFEKVMPYGAPSVTLLPKHVLETVESAVDGYKRAIIRLSCGKGKCNLRVESIVNHDQMKPPSGGLAKTVDCRVETATLEDPCPFDDFGMGAKYNATYLTEALAGFDGHARIYYVDEESPLIIGDETGRVAIVMPLV